MARHGANHGPKSSMTLKTLGASAPTTRGAPVAAPPSEVRPSHRSTSTLERYASRIPSPVRCFESSPIHRHTLPPRSTLFALTRALLIDFPPASFHDSPRRPCARGEPRTRSTRAHAFTRAFAAAHVALDAREIESFVIDVAGERLFVGCD